MSMKFKELRESLPLLIPRSQPPRQLGGLYTAKYLANLAARGEGPPFIKIGRKVVYLRDDFVNWLEERAN